MHKVNTGVYTERCQCVGHELIGSDSSRQDVCMFFLLIHTRMDGGQTCSLFKTLFYPLTHPGSLSPLLFFWALTVIP